MNRRSYVGKGNPMYGKKRPDRSKLNRDRKGIFKHTEESKQKTRESCKGINKGNKNAMKNPIYLQRMKDAVNKRDKQVWGEKISKSCKENWAKNKEERLKKLRATFTKYPSSYEVKLMNLIKKNNLSFVYVGNGSFWIGYSNPDFINKENKICIEVYSRFYHPGNYEEERSNHFQKYGWKTIFINDDIINDENLMLQKINDNLRKLYNYKINLNMKKYII